MNKFLLFTVISSISASALAADLSYNTLSVDYVRPESGDGFSINGTVGISDSFFLAADYSRITDTGAVGNGYAVGVGYHTPISSNTDFVGTLSYVNTDVDIEILGTTLSGSDGGLGVGLGLRYKPNDSIELVPAVAYDSVSEDFSIGTEIRYFFTEKFSIGAGYAYGFDVESGVFNGGVRFDF